MPNNAMNGVFILSYFDQRILDLQQFSYDDILINNPVITPEMFITGTTTPTEGNLLYSYNRILYGNRVKLTITWSVSNLTDIGGFKILDENRDIFNTNGLELIIEQFGNIPMVELLPNLDGMDPLGYFENIQELQISSTAGSPNFRNISSLDNCFKNCTNFNSDISSWDMSNIQSIGSIFYNCYVFNQPLNTWNVKNIINFENAFHGALQFNQPLNRWDVSNATYMNNMFDSAISFNQNLSSWNLSNEIISIDGIFNGALSFNNGDIIGGKKLNLGTGWNSARCWTKEFAEYGCPLTRENAYPLIPNGATGTLVFSFIRSNATEYDLAGINPINEINYAPILIDPNNRQLYYDKPILEVINEEYDIVKVSVKWTATGKTVIYPLNGLNFNSVVAEYNIGSSDPSYNDLSYNDLSYNDLSYNDLSYNIISVPYYANRQLKILQFGNIPLCSDIVGNFGSVFENLGNVTFADNCGIPNIVPNTNLTRCFYHTNIIGSIGNWNTKNVTIMNQMFSYSNFTSSLDKWNVSNVSSMMDIFNGSNMNQNINTWNVSNVTQLDGAFQGAYKYNQPLNKWNVSKVLTLNNMFNGATSFNQSLSTWNVSNVMSMSKLFYNAISFNQNLSSWKLTSIPTAPLYPAGSSPADNVFGGALSFNNGFPLGNTTNPLGIGWYSVRIAKDISNSPLYSNQSNNLLYCPLTNENSWPINSTALTATTLTSTLKNNTLTIPINKTVNLTQYIISNRPFLIAPLTFNKISNGLNIQVQYDGTLQTYSVGSGTIIITQSADAIFTSGTLVINVIVTAKSLNKHKRKN